VLGSSRISTLNTYEDKEILGNSSISYYIANAGLVVNDQMAHQSEIRPNLNDI